MNHILSRLKTKCPFTQVFEEIENPGEFAVRYRRKIGHLRADYDGFRWWNTGWPMHKELATPEVCREIDAVYDALTAKDAFADLDALRKYCSQFPEALANPEQDDEYNFYLEGERCLFWLRCITRRGDYNLYLHAFVREKEQSQYQHDGKEEK